MAQDTVDVVVLGMGPGGEDVANRLARAGLEVVGIDQRLVGGECPYYGCIPSKMMIRAANALAEGRRVGALAGSATVTPDWEPVARRIREEATDDWNDQVAVERFEDAGGRFVRARGRLAGGGRVVAGDIELAARRAIVVSTGTEPALPPVEGLAGTPFWTNREAVSTSEVPESLVVLGGGAIGCELAQVFARFGARVTVVEAAERLLPLEEPEAGQILAEVFEQEGLALRTGSSVRRVGHDATGFTLHLDDGDGGLSAARLLVATGRRTDLAGAGLGSVGVDPEARFVPVDGRCRVTDGVYAVGDITGKGGYTHVSMYQADLVVRDILDQGGPDADYRALPRVTFTDPEVGVVGLTEQQARDAGLRVRVGSTPMPSVARGWIHGPGNEGVIKIVVDADRDRIVGATAMGPAGGEVLGALAVAVHAEVPTDRLRHMLWAYPTFHRGVQSALDDAS